MGAAVIFDNLLADPATASDFRQADWIDSTAWVYVAQSFTTGSSSYELTEVTLALSSSSPGSLLVALYSNNSGVPGTALEYLSTSDSASTTSYAYLTLSGRDYVLAANTTYWIVLCPTSGIYSWATDSSSSGTGLMRVSGVNRTRWYTGPAGNVGTQIMKVEGDLVGGTPEPSTLLLGLPALAVCVRRGRRR